ncbi:GNAT family N-acetyltransferase [Alkaliphilus hydrothermalis]|uniref:RimJ/RimL family protein N-acetyltransferase n=1 Tax=Alkaliphilus hydrothermalis TaxID=1482730 RepID=A0ABS2NLH5_9FIRM|nr:GNAT family N-acetyltransferase [Alkaliphilus hydrothermalis]MBM7613785.1 RimJ/RimL family protein N-acetyltransferase [Alkaliphilus hydrothermalis]
MRKIFVETSQIRIRNTKEEDLDFVVTSERDPANAAYVDQWGIDKHSKSLTDKDILHLIIEDRTNNNKVGYMIVAGLQNPHHSIELKRLVITTPGKGFGREVLRLMKRLAFQELDGHRLWLDVRCSNDRAHNLYKSEGFKDEGILRDCVLYNGKYESIIMMSILENEIEKI